VWAAHSTVEGDELSTRLARAGVLIAAGSALDAPRHVRISLRNSSASDRLIGAIDKALA
jgi:histidinol-phosphate/aromatic aminotransferase/cobyric acid decarboxylase-like protein